MVIGVVFVHVDKSGRILIPKNVRDEINADSFDLEVEKEKIILNRVKSISDMRGFLPSLTYDVWKREHDKER